MTTATASVAHCAACKALRDETQSDELFDFYARKLLIRGWAGKTSPIEKAYIAAHPPDWYKAALAAAAQSTQRFGVPATTQKSGAKRDAGEG
jgi:hypothetical protein